MCVDPDINNIKTVTHENKEYIVEICDAVQNCGYDIGAPEGIITGLTVSDFVYPKWFGIDQNRLPGGTISTLYSFRNSVKKPFELASEGYISAREPGKEWTPIFGDKIKSLPPWASRLPRIGAV